MPRRLPNHIKHAPHIRLDANFCDDERIRQAGEKAAWLYLAMACESRRRRTDGTLPAHVIPRLGVPSWKPRLAALISAGLIENTGNQYRIPAYLKWNMSEEDYERNSHMGRIGGCRAKHPQPCDVPVCMDSRRWVEDHPDHQPP